MNARTSIITAAAILALAVPAAQAATSNIPWDTRSGYGYDQDIVSTRTPQGTGHVVVKGKSKGIRLGSYNPHAYVPGGSSPQVSKAITDAGRRTAQ